MPVEIVKNTEDADKADCVVCVRVNDVPIPYAEGSIETCPKCQERIWVSHTSPKKPPRLCYPCATAQMQADGEEPIVMVTERTIKEAAPFLRKMRKDK